MDGERERKILEKLDREGYVKTGELSRELGCAEITLRRDLEDLDRRGLLKRIHGGAVKTGSNFVYGSVKEALYRNLYEKMKIAKIAYNCIEDGETILIDDASTCIHMASMITGNMEKHLKIITNSIIFAEKLLDYSHVELTLIGGNVSRNLAATEGSMALSQLGKLSADKAFIGVNGIDLETGITLTGYPQLKVKQKMMEISRETYILADNSKFGQTYMSLLCPVDRPAAIVTDPKIDREICVKAQRMGVKILTKSS